MSIIFFDFACISLKLSKISDSQIKFSTSNNSVKNQANLTDYDFHFMIRLKIMLLFQKYTRYKHLF